MSLQLDDATTPAARSIEPSGRAGGVLLLVVASVLWSVSGVALKVLKVDAIAFAFWRSLGAGVCMAALLPFSRGAPPRAAFMVLAIFLHAVVVTLLLNAMALSTAAAGIILQYTGPVFCAMFAWMFQARRLSPRTAAALSIAMAGVAIMLIGGLRGGASIAGLVNGAVSGVAFGGLILTLELVNRRPDGQPVNPLLIVMLNNLGTAVIVLPIATMHTNVAMEPWKLSLMMLTGCVQLAVPYVLFVLALRRVEPVDASLLILLEPVLNPVWVWLAVGERPDWSTFVGGAAILVAMVIEATKNR